MEVRYRSCAASPLHEVVTAAVGAHHATYSLDGLQVLDSRGAPQVEEVLANATVASAAALGAD